MKRRNLTITLIVLAALLFGSVFTGYTWISADLQEARVDRANWVQEEAWKKERNETLVLLWGEKIWANTAVEDYLMLCEPSRTTKVGDFQRFYHGNPDSTSVLMILAKSGELVYASDSSCNHRTDFFDRLTNQDRKELKAFWQ